MSSISIGIESFSAFAQSVATASRSSSVFGCLTSIPCWSFALLLLPSTG